jgi:hypothetical protein
MSAPRPDVEAAAPLDHRALQRALFRMQLDPRFAAQLLDGDPEAQRSAGLGSAELRLLDGVDPRALEADAGGRRRRQFLHNVTSEFPLTLAVVAGDLLEGFSASPVFHRAVAQSEILPLAFAEYLTQVLPEGNWLPRALLELEVRLARARRSEAPACVPPPAGHVVLAEEIELARVREGTFATASAIRSALDQRRPIPSVRDATLAESETLLVQPQPRASAFALRSIHIERLPPAVADLLETCQSPQSKQALRAYADARGIDPKDLYDVVESFRADRVLLGSLQ